MTKTATTHDPVYEATQNALAVIETVKAKLQEAVKKESGIEIAIKDLGLAHSPRIKGDLFVRFSANATGLDKVKIAFANVSDSSAAPRSIRSAKGNGFTVQMKPDYAKLGL